MTESSGTRPVDSVIDHGDAPVDDPAKGPAGPAADAPVDAPADSAASPARRRVLRRLLRVLPVVAPVLLWAVPGAVVLYGGQDWPVAVTAAGTALCVLGMVVMPWALARGHGRRQSDRATITGTTLLGVSWVLFTWSVLHGVLLRLVLYAAGVGEAQDRARIVAWAVLGTAAALLTWGFVEARRVPRVRETDVVLPRLGAGLDGTRVALITDTHYGPLDRARWSARVCERLNALDADIVCHTGDIADGTAERRRAQAEPLGTVRARWRRVYVTGNHEYYSEAQGWVDLMGELGWEPLRNRHLLYERDGDRLVVAGVDDVTAEHSGLPGHGASLKDALDGADPALPVLLLAHQPAFVRRAAAAGVDLQLSGHTHGGQIWPFHLLVRLDQPALAGLTRHGERTQLYTSRGTGFWGPPFRVFAPSEITLLVLRAGREVAV